MAFTTKLKLISEKFFQPSGSTLDLSGTTIIAETGDLKYENHPTFTTDTQIVDKKYVDDLITGASTGITQSLIYSGESPSTVDVGGLNAGSELTGYTSNELLEMILVATLYPTLTPPSSTFNVYTDSNRTVTMSAIDEVGLNKTYYTRATFNRGSINPQYTAASEFRSGPAVYYAYTGNGLPISNNNTTNTDDQIITDHTIAYGANTWGGSVNYSQGVQPYDSKGVIYQSPLPAGNTATITKTTNGIYPYFYGYSVSAPTFNQTLIDGSTKVLQSSNDTVTVNYGSTGSVYYWLAIPFVSTAKLGYYFTELNKGNIGGVEDLFGPEQTGSINSPNGYWSGVTYRFYVTQYATNFNAVAIQYRNTAQA